MTTINNYTHPLTKEQHGVKGLLSLHHLYQLSSKPGWCYLGCTKCLALAMYFCVWALYKIVT